MKNKQVIVLLLLRAVVLTFAYLCISQSILYAGDGSEADVTPEVDVSPFVFATPSFTDAGTMTEKVLFPPGAQTVIYTSTIEAGTPTKNFEIDVEAGDILKVAVSITSLSEDEFNDFNEKHGQKFNNRLGELSTSSQEVGQAANRLWTLPSVIAPDITYLAPVTSRYTVTLRPFADLPSVGYSIRFSRMTPPEKSQTFLTLGWDAGSASNEKFADIYKAILPGQSIHYEIDGIAGEWLEVASDSLDADVMNMIRTPTDQMFYSKQTGGHGGYFTNRIVLPTDGKYEVVFYTQKDDSPAIFSSRIRRSDTPSRLYFWNPQRRIHYSGILVSGEEASFFPQETSADQAFVQLILTSSSNQLQINTNTEDVVTSFKNPDGSTTTVATLTEPNLPYEIQLSLPITAADTNYEAELVTVPVDEHVNYHRSSLDVGDGQIVNQLTAGIMPGGTQTYTLSGQAGQRLKVETNSFNSLISFRIIFPQMGELQSTRVLAKWYKARRQFILPHSGEYTIEVILEEGADPAVYTLDIDYE